MLRRSKLGSISSLRCHKSRNASLKDLRCEVMFSRTFYQFATKRRLPVFAFQASPGHASFYLAWPLSGWLRHPQPKAKRGGARRDRTDDLMLAKHALSQLSYGPVLEDEMHCRALSCWPPPALQRSSLRSRRACRAEAAEQRRLVGLGRLELPTSRLSSARSNQLSYKPLTLSREGLGKPDRARSASADAQRSPLRVFVREERET